MAFDSLPTFTSSTPRGAGDPYPGHTVINDIVSEIKTHRHFYNVVPPSVADGSNIDSHLATAITYAAANPYTTLYLRKGTWLKNMIPVLPTKTTLAGAGMDATILRNQNGYSPTLQGRGFTTIQAATGGVQDITIENLTIDGNAWNGDAVRWGAFTGAATFGNSHHLDLRDIDHVRIERVRLIGAGRYSLYMQDCTNIKVLNCEQKSGTAIHGANANQQDGYHFTNCLNGLVKGCRADTGATGYSGDDPFVLRTVSAGTWGHFVFDDCTIVQSGTRGFAFSGEQGTIEHVTISKCMVHNTDSAGVILNYYDTPTGGTIMYRHILVEGCHFIDCNRDATDGSHVWYLQHPATINGVTNHRDGWEHVTFAKNTINGVPRPTGYYMGVERGRDLKVLDNVMIGVQANRGIALFDSVAPVIRALIRGNTIDVTGSASACLAILLGACQYVTVEGNIIRGHKTGTTYGVWHNANATNAGQYNVVINNHMYTMARGFGEANSGAAPNNNTVTLNHWHDITTPTTVLGAQTTTAGNYTWTA